MKRMIVLVVFATAIGAQAAQPVKPLKAKEWDNDLYGFVPGKFYFQAGLGAINLNAAAANRLKNEIAPNWKAVSIDGKPIWFAKGEYAISRHSGLGLTFAHSGFDINASLDSLTKLNIPVSGTLSYRSWSLLARYNFHVFPEKRFDLYGGIGLGYRANKFRLTDNDPDYSWWNFPIDLNVIKKVIPANLTSVSYPTFGADLTIGMRYHILPPLAVYAEFGTAKSIAQGGVVIRF